MSYELSEFAAYRAKVETVYRVSLRLVYPLVVVVVGRRNR